MIMVKPIKGTYRKSTGYLNQRISKRNVQGLDTDGQFDDELWILLEYYSEVEDMGKKHLASLGVPKVKLSKTFKHFQSYIRQAKNYYFSAEELHPRSAGLLYYYCFLNLAKAFIVQNDPSIGGVKIGHGVSCLSKDFSKIRNQTVKVLTGNDVFQRYYSIYFGVSIKQMSLNINELFRYCTDISYQCDLAGIGSRKVEPCLYVHLVNKGEKTGWPVLGIPNFEAVRKYPKSLSELYKNFEQIDIPEHDAREFFDTSNFVLSRFTFLQSKQAFNWIGDNIPPILESRDLVLNSLKGMLQTNYFEDDYSFLLSLPYKINNQIPMDETIAIYLVMFYLSNLVRYNPSYLEKLLSKKEAWLIDSFVRSCSTTFLRSMVSRIVDIDFVIGRR
jgi:hypothetical protein